MRKFTLLIALIASFSFVNAQVFIQEDFSDNQMPPSGWSIDGYAANWSVASSAEAGGTAPEAKFTYSSDNDITRLIAPPVDLTGHVFINLSFDYFYDYYGNPAPKLGVATRSGGGEWTSYWEITPTGNVGPTSELLTIINTDVGQPDFEFCIYLDGDFYNLDYVYFDNFELFIPYPTDCDLLTISSPSVVTGPTPVTGTFKNKGSNNINSVDISWQVADGDVFTTTFDGLNLELGDTYDFECNDLFNFPVGPHELNVWVAMVNGGDDNNPENDMQMKYINVASWSEARVPCYEEFTSSTCGPCATFNTPFVPWTETNADDITLIKYQMNWPGSGDPYYTNEGGVRRGFYGVTWVPWLVGDGGFLNTNMADVTSFYNEAMDNPSFAAITSTHTLSGTTMDIVTTVLPYAGFENSRVHVIVFEYLTTENVASNGETEFHHVMMKMVPDANGTATDFVDREPVTYTQSVDLDGTNVEEWDDLGVIVIVQDYLTGAVYQSAYSMESATFATDDDITGISVDGEPVAGFDPAVMDYYMELPDGTTEVPVVTADAFDPTARVVIVPAFELPGKTTIDVFAEDLATHQQYSVDFTVLQSVDNPLATNVKLYPNPTKGVLHISGFENANVYVYSSTGKMVAEFTDFTGGSIDISGMASGIYFINIQTEENTVTKKVALNR